MPQGIQVFGDDGSIWLDTNQITTRLAASIIMTSLAYPPDPTQANGARYRNFTIPAGTTPWVIATGSNGTIVQCAISKQSATLARLEYAVGPGITGSWPAGAKVIIHYGWG